MKKAYCILLCIFVFFSCMCVSTQAANTDLTLSEVSEEEKLNFEKKLTLFKQQNNTDAFSDAFIYSLSVSAAERCAILKERFLSWMQKRNRFYPCSLQKVCPAVIAVYDANGDLLRVLKFHENFLENLRTPSEVSIGWQNDNLLLFYSTQHVLVYDLDGNLLNVYQYEHDASLVYSSAQYTVNDTVYQLEYSSPLIHYLGGNRYNVLSKTTADEETTILFKSSKALPSATVSALLTFAFVFITPGVVALCIFYKKKQKHP